MFLCIDDIADKIFLVIATGFSSKAYYSAVSGVKRIEGEISITSNLRRGVLFDFMLIFPFLLCSHPFPLYLKPVLLLLLLLLLLTVSAGRMLKGKTRSRSLELL